MLSKLPFDFYNRHVVDVAQDLLGKTLVWGEVVGMITETEAYQGLDDEASHAFRGPTKRSQIMFDAPGFVYVYLIYGIHHCFNIVTEEKGKPAAVLIRGLKLNNLHLQGPGKICSHLKITREHNGIDLTTHENKYLMQGQKIKSFKTTTRIGIQKAREKPWRFVIEDIGTSNPLPE